jgi:hypothetical protein
MSRQYKIISVNDKFDQTTKYAIVDVHIRNNETNEVRTTQNYELIWDNERNQPHFWNFSDGNYSCDCNRHIMFEGEFLEHDCSEGKYSVNIVNLVTGKLVYQEFLSLFI